MPADLPASSAPTLDAPLREALAALAAEATGLEVTVAQVELSAPRQAGHGDLATNLAMVLAKRAGQPPRAVAEAIAAGLPAALPGQIAGVEVAGPAS